MRSTNSTDCCGHLITLANGRVVRSQLTYIARFEDKTMHIQKNQQRRHTFRCSTLTIARTHSYWMRSEWNRNEKSNRICTQRAYLLIGCQLTPHTHTRTSVPYTYAKRSRGMVTANPVTCVVRGSSKRDKMLDAPTRKKNKMLKMGKTIRHAAKTSPIIGGAQQR